MTVMLQTMEQTKDMTLCKGRYRARFAACARDVEAAQRLRARAFLPGRKGGDLDRDRFDPLCRHALVEDIRDGRLVCCFRLLPLPSGRKIGTSYSAQFYDLSGLARFAAPMAEMGRFCLDPEIHDPDILRLALALMTRFVDVHRIRMLFGCSSFAGIEAAAYQDAFALLNARHLGPGRWLPKIKAVQVLRFIAQSPHKPDLDNAIKEMPPLLRTYLAMGGWVSDHAVVDRDLNTLHVFTGLDIQAIPPARARLLRAISA